LWLWLPYMNHRPVFNPIAFNCATFCLYVLCVVVEKCELVPFKIYQLQFNYQCCTLFDTMISLSPLPLFSLVHSKVIFKKKSSRSVSLIFLKGSFLSLSSSNIFHLNKLFSIINSQSAWWMKASNIDSIFMSSTLNNFWLSYQFWRKENWRAFYDSLAIEFNHLPTFLSSSLGYYEIESFEWVKDAQYSVVFVHCFLLLLQKRMSLMILMHV
jgi:hypothetical protein